MLRIKFTIMRSLRFGRDDTGNMKTKILVTGAKGQLGKKIIDLLSGKYTLVLTDSDDMDITEESQVHKVTQSEKPDIIIHGAAYTKVDLAEEEKDRCKKINSDGTKNLALAAADLDIPIIYISTDYVFDGEKKSPYIETDAPHPLSVYGKTKLDGERDIRNICTKFYILRVSWLFGELPEGHPGTNFIETMLRLSKERNSLSVVNDQTGSPTYTRDLVEIIDLIVSKKESIPFGLYHLSGNGECSWYDFAKEIFRLAKVSIALKPITSDQYPQRAKRPTHSYMCKKKIEKTLNISVRSWQEMVADYLSCK